MKSRLWLFFSFLFFCLASGQKSSAPIAVIVKMKGEVQVQESGGKAWVAAKTGQVLLRGNSIKTGKDGLAMVKFLDDKSMLRLKSKTLLAINEKADSARSVREIAMQAGAALFQIQKQDPRRNFSVATPTGVATVKGTVFWVMIEGRLSRFVGLKDSVEVRHVSSGKRILLGPGRTATTNDKGIEERATKPDDLPEGEREHSLRFEFKNKNGNARALLIDFGNTE